MKSELLNFLNQYKKEVTIAIITAVTALLFTKALPAFLSFLRDCGAYVLALLTGHRREYKFEKKYLAWLINQNKYLINVPSEILSPAHLPKPAEMESAYIQLRLKRSSEAPLELAISDVVRPGSKTVVLGDPGSGKTTQLRYFCLTYARLAKTPIFSYGKKKLLRSRFQSKGNRIPILIYLNRLAETDLNILSAAERFLPESLTAIYPVGYFQRVLETGKCIILLDGLDEVPTTKQRNRVAEAISSLTNATNDRNTWIVSSRIVGYKTQLQNSFETAIVQPLTLTQVERFVENWYRIKCDSSGFPESELVNQRESYSQRAKNLINTIRLNPGLASLTTSPILVSLVALLHSVKIELPQSRALLYHDCIELLADRWDLSRGVKLDAVMTIPVAQKILALMSIASHMHSQRLREIKRSELEKIISSQFAKVFKSSGEVLPGQIIDDLEERSGLLINRGLTEASEKIMAFSHLSFQEYLTARSLRSTPRSDAKRILATHFSDSWWREAILLYVAQMDSPRSLIEQIYADSFNDNPMDKVLLAAACLSEVKADKTDELYIKVFGDVAFMYSCGEIQDVAITLLESDKNNMLLRHMVDYLLRTTPQQARGLEILLNSKRQVEIKAEVVEKFVAEYDYATELLNYDLRVINAIFRYRVLPAEPIVSMIFRSPSDLEIPKELLLAKPVSHQQLASVALAHSDWTQIIGKLAALSPYADADGRSAQPPIPEGPDWRHKLIAALICKHQTRQQGTDGPPAEARKNLGKVKECLDRIAERNYSEATAIYRTLHGWIEPEDALVCEKDIERAFEQSDAVGRRLCVMLVLRFKAGQRTGAELLIRFISDTLKLLPRMKLSNSREVDTGEQSTNLLAISLVRRAMNSLSQYEFSSHEHINFLLRCLESGLPEVVDFASASLERLKTIDHEALENSVELLKSPQPVKVWAALLILSLAGAPTGSLMDMLLPKLYEKEVIVRDKNLGDLAANSMLRILSHGTTELAIQ